MIRSTDVGSLPLKKGQTRTVEQRVIEGLVDKLNAGIEVPNFPQFRDMNLMFLSMIEGLEKIEGGYVEADALRVKSGEGRIAEMQIIKRNAGQIAHTVGRPVEIRFCITGPYTLSSLFIYKNAQTFARLGNVLAEILEQNLFREKQCAVVLVSVDEPVFGFLDDPLLDRGSEGREALLKAWETIFHKASAKNVETSLHLHRTSDPLFWEIRNLQIVESHVDDPFYESETTKKKLETEDKFIKASICRTEFDVLIRKKLEALHVGKVSTQEIGDVWKQITRKNLDPKSFIEDINTMKIRLRKIVNQFSVERVSYAGPECGLKGFPTYECAIECLKRVATAIKTVKLNP